MAFTAALGLVSISQGIVVLLLALIVFYPAGGAFVSLSQVSLMDTDPSRREQNMVRWEFAGSVGNVVGPLALAAAIAPVFAWCGMFLSIAILTTPTLIAARRVPLEHADDGARKEGPSFVTGLLNAP